MSTFYFVVVSTAFGIGLTGWSPGSVISQRCVALSSPSGVWTQPSALPCASLYLTTENAGSVSLPPRMLVGIRTVKARGPRSVTPAKRRPLRRTLQTLPFCACVSWVLTHQGLRPCPFPLTTPLPTGAAASAPGRASAG